MGQVLATFHYYVSGAGNSLGPNIRFIIYICPGGQGGNGGAGGTQGGAGGEGGGPMFNNNFPAATSLIVNFPLVVPNGTVLETAPQPEVQVDGMGRGFPLYRPEPQINLPAQYREKGVAIGDVGTVTVDGDFDFFFNIYINGLKDLIPLPPYHPMEDIKCYPHSIRKIGSLGSTLGADFIFNCTAPNGAVLALPHGGQVEKLRPIRFMREYAAKNAESWYKYLNGTKGFELMNGSLLLITGCENAKSWGMAMFPVTIGVLLTQLRLRQ
ncbi:hypothetical protein B0H14DRAFT_2562619 [Mycena olivaceomarginata]|nr:hypothetical protein B0H14DRAFT_2562619 [Mycena olivaceomarginata]